MNKLNLIHRISHELGMSQAEAGRWVQRLHDIILDTLKCDDKVLLTGFGTFLVSQRVPRKGRNPKTGETMMLPAFRNPRFRPGKEFKMLVNTK